MEPKIDFKELEKKLPNGLPNRNVDIYQDNSVVRITYRTEALCEVQKAEISGIIQNYLDQFEIQKFQQNTESENNRIVVTSTMKKKPMTTNDLGKPYNLG